MATFSSANTYGKSAPKPASYSSQEAVAAGVKTAQAKHLENFQNYIKAKPVAQANPYAAQLMEAAGAGSASSLQSTSNQLLEQMLRDPTKLQAMPGYQFQMDQGLQALNRGLAGRGHLNSGNRDIELTKYGQGLAAQQYGSMAGMLIRAGAGAGQQAGQTFGNLLSASKFGYDTQAADQDRLSKQFNDEILRAQNADVFGEAGLVDEVYRKYKKSDSGWGY